MNGKAVPLSLAFEQRQNLAALAQVGVVSVFSFLRPKTNPAAFQAMDDEIDAPSDRLIESYLDWVGAPAAQRNKQIIPPAMFSQWSIPLATKILLQTRYSLSNIINLGCEIKVNGPIHRGHKLKLHAEMINLDESETRVKFSVKVVTGSVLQENAVEAIFHTMLPKFALTFVEAKPREDRQWETAGAWSVDENDGFRFALLTGDFNPVHWVDYAARQSPFRQKILHGFGSLALCWEALQQRENEGVFIKKINVRFSRPVPLPSASMFVFRSEPRASGARRVELKSQNGYVHMIGDYKTE